MKRSRSGPNPWGSILQGQANYDVHVGIDPGLKGALAILHNGKLSLYTLPIKNRNELDAVKLNEIPIPLGRVAVCCEDVLTIPGHKFAKGTLGAALGKGGMSAQAMRLVGQNFGVLKTWAELRGFAWKAARPLLWQNTLGLTSAQSRVAVPGGPKARAFVMAQNLFPSQDFHSYGPTGIRSKHPHDGLVDAALIAYFAKSFVI